MSKKFFLQKSYADVVRGKDTKYNFVLLFINSSLNCLFILQKFVYLLTHLFFLLFPDNFFHRLIIHSIVTDKINLFRAANFVN